MTVVEFKSRRGLLKQQLEEGMSEMEELYQQLDRAYQAMNRLEDHVEARQGAYDRRIVEYANEIKPENVEVGFLQYATNVAVRLHPDGMEIVLNEKDEDE